MSSRRKGFVTSYHTGYLKSPAWFARRGSWIANELATKGHIECPLCLTNVDRKSVELHHVSYDGVKRTRTGWQALEADEDLVGMHKRCHEWVHRLLDQDAYYGHIKNRRLATRLVIERLQTKLRNELLRMIEEGHTSDTR